VIAALAGSAAGCLVQYHPVAPRSPSALVPVELNRYMGDRWPVYLDVVAGRDARIRRLAWANPGSPPCAAGAPLRWTDRGDSSSPDVDVVQGQRLRLGLRDLGPTPPVAQGPTVLDVEEVVSGGGTACLRIPMTGDRPEEQWASTRKWVNVFDLGYGWAAATAGDDRPIRFGGTFDATVGVGRWIGPIRADGAMALGAVGCTGCAQDWLPYAGAQLGVGLLAWEGPRGVLELGVAYRLAFATDRNDTFALHAARAGVVVGLKPPPLVGIVERARAGFGGLALYGEWRTPASSQAASQLVVGLGLVARFYPF
jgi:hypothetical protein